MDDLAGMLSQFLSSEDGMNQVRAVASALGLDAPRGDAQASDAAAPPSAPAPEAASPPLDANTLLLLQQAAGVFQKNDANTDLLRALKPHFSPERAARVDDAIRILQLLRLLPILTAGGFFRGGSSR